MAEADESTEETGAEGKKKSKLVLIIALVVGVLLVGGGGAAVAFFLLGDDQPAAEEVAATPEKAEAIYTKVRTKEGKPMFVVTLQSLDQRRHYLQVHVEAKSRDPAVDEALTLHMPKIVAELNTLFSTQKFEQLQTVEGKIKLRQDATDLVREIMQQLTDEPGVETILFTSFVMQ